MDRVIEADTLDDLPHMLKVPEIGELLRIGRSRAYQLVHEENLAIRVGPRALRVPRQKLINFLEDNSLEANLRRE